MRYIVVHDGPKGVGISVNVSGTLYDHKIKCWAMNTGARVEFASFKMHKLLEQFYLGGSYSDFARYVIDFDELCSILRDRIGPSDDERYHALVAARRTSGVEIERRQRVEAAATVLRATSFAWWLPIKLLLVGVRALLTGVLAPMIAALLLRKH